MQAPLYKDLVLIGGGHSHAQVLKIWGMKPIPGVRLSLISPLVQTLYSGMLPGLIAGHYDFDATHIDLVRLCQFAQARFIQATVTHIDVNTAAAGGEIYLLDRPPIIADVISINSGITPDLSVPGAAGQVIPVKPIADFYSRWQQLCCRLQQWEGESVVNIGVVGGGAAGVELILSMHYALSRDSAIEVPLAFHLIQGGRGLPESYPRKIQSKLSQQFARKGINTYDNFVVKAVKEDGLLSSDNRRVQLQEIFWCTSARAATWPRDSGLGVDSQGFIAVNKHLQSTTHGYIFAAGDIASQAHAPRPKAGVFAVRQGPVLAKNLRRYLLRQPLKNYRPQKQFLSLLACGGKYALGCRGALSFSGAWVWRWKDRIDRRFMQVFSQLPAMSVPTGVLPLPPPAEIRGSNEKVDSVRAAMRCGGCGAKVGADSLARVLARLRPRCKDGVLLDLHTPDDAAVISLPAQQLLLQSVDFFRALVDDPYLQGCIAAHHALSDIFAMHGRPHSAQAIVVLPHGGDRIIERDLYQLLAGAEQVMNDHQCQLIGGHTGEGAELSIGFSINGTATEEALLYKSGIASGEVLILTKPLGTGTLFAAHMHNSATGGWLQAAIDSMNQSNATAAEILYRQGASACTDVTGFGVLGHLLEMLRASHCSACLTVDNLPVLNGALWTLKQGFVSSLHAQNSDLSRGLRAPEKWREHPLYPLLFDPQTSGGLLASVPADGAAACVGALHDAGYKSAAVIGKAVAASSVPDTGAEIYVVDLQ